MGSKRRPVACPPFLMMLVERGWARRKRAFAHPTRLCSCDIFAASSASLAQPTIITQSMIPAADAGEKSPPLRAK